MANYGVYDLFYFFGIRDAHKTQKILSQRHQLRESAQEKDELDFLVDGKIAFKSQCHQPTTWLPK